MPKTKLLDMSDDELRELDLELRQQGYKLDADREDAFAKHIAPLKAKKKALNHERSKIAAALEFRGQTRSPAQREVLAELLSVGEED